MSLGGRLLVVIVFPELLDEPAGEAKLLLKLADALAKEFLGWKDIGHLDAVVGSYSERCGDTFEGEFYFFLIELGTNE